MTTVQQPTGATTRDVLAALAAAGVTDVDDSTVTRAAYSTDASLYRVVPLAVVRPRHTDEVLATLEVARRLGVPLTARGAGTSVAGNAVGPGLVLDVARHLDRVLEVDPEARTARVQPGTVHAVLQRAAAPHGLRYGPDPSTHTRCTVGGMLGNNACGNRALGYGRAADNVAGLSVAFGTGEVWSGRRAGADGVGAALTGLVDAHLAHVRTEFGRFTRQVSGYSLEHLLPEHDRRLDRFLVGSEGTLGLWLEAEVDLVVEPERRILVLLGYPGMAEAGDAVPGLPRGPVSCEGLDSRIVDLVRSRGGAVPELPRGAGWLFVEVTDPDLAAAVVAASGALDTRVVTDAAEMAALWRIREDGAGLASRSLGRPAYSGWEDAAVPPERLGAWLRDFEELLAAHDLRTLPYGHFGDGCVHARIDFELTDPVSGPRRFREFLVACAERLRAHGGSLSGEHGDGRARSELLPLMYDETSLRLFGAVKAVCDPDGVLNPGVLVDPDPLDAHLRAPRPVQPVRPLLRMVHDGGSLAAAVHRCTGVGKCVAPQAPGAGGGVMCPSWQATREEKDSTRGRSRVLQEALDGELVHGLADPAVADALDLCLACKGCASDCPTGVDMATYKAEALHQRHDVEGVRRPRSHVVLGRLPVWARLTAPVAPLANATLRVAPLARVARRVAGVDQRRSLPSFARRTLRRLERDASRRAGTPDVWVWADSFTDHFQTESGVAALAFLRGQGLDVRVIDERACCALTWITTGQLDRAGEIVTRSVATLAPYVASGVPVLGLEPSCTAALRSDSVELCEDPRAVEVASGVVTLGELLTRLVGEGRVRMPDLSGTTVVAQPHCHQHAVLGWDADERLLRAAGAQVLRVPGCCGLAGNFGMEEGHYEVSVAVAGTHLLPTLDAHPGAVVLADGMSCQVQLEDLRGVRALHLAELLAERAAR